MDADIKNGRGNTGGRYPPQLLPPRLMEGAIPASPKMTRLSDRIADSSRPSSRPSSANRRSSGNQEDIQPYMTSSHVKAQMQKNFKYTPFSHQQGPQQPVRAGTVSATDVPRVGKQPLKSGENTWI